MRRHAFNPGIFGLETNRGFRYPTRRRLNVSILITIVDFEDRTYMMSERSIAVSDVKTSTSGSNSIWTIQLERETYDAKRDPSIRSGFALLSL
ncbi:hypothetical protein GHT06_017571 [Daphnia sinensis]|uniref:Uncharacterized protein n=1 Tax=Daphnia sinensis TaxID=1820382 RepID=A0AAD5KQ02_9CRUS|nr:hypothetical protein GHT06_017571 [Daphnia sinensis]